MNLYRVYSLCVEHYPGLFMLANFGKTVALAGQWHANPRPWNRSATLEADSLEHAFVKGNDPDRWSDVRSVSVGDVIEDHATKACFLVTPSGFLNIGRPKDACPHAATITPEQCEFCADERDYELSVANGDELYDLPF